MASSLPMHRASCPVWFQMLTTLALPKNEKREDAGKPDFLLAWRGCCA
jgi:hypothetical protein